MKFIFFRNVFKSKLEIRLEREINKIEKHLAIAKEYKSWGEIKRLQPILAELMFLKTGERF